MVFTCYFDESGTHAGSEITAMAGFLGNDRQWRNFEKRASKLFARFRVDIFHTIDVRRSDKDFEGWSVDRKIEFLDEFQHIINDALEGGVASIIKDADYKYYLSLPWPRKARRDSKYGILFRACLSQTVETVSNIQNAWEPRLHTVVEDGARNAGDVVRIYDWIKSRVRAPRGVAGLTFDSKKTCLPLAAADLFAYSAWGQEVGQKPIGVPRKPIKSEASYKGNFWRVEVNRNTLDRLHEQAVRLANERPRQNLPE
jgi:hypothetical protein